MSSFKRGMFPPNPTREDVEDHMLSPMVGRSMPMWHAMHQFAQYGEKKISNTIIETDLAAEGVGSPVLDAGYFSYRGKMVESMTMGYWEKTATSDLTLRVRMATFDAENVTFQDAGNTITKQNHGITAISANNMDCTFTVINTTTGIIINTVYFIVPSTITAHTFQVAATRTFAGLVPTTGAAINLVNDGTGSMTFSTIIHVKIFSSARIGPSSRGHFEIGTMTTAMTLEDTGTINMHGDLLLKEADSAEILGLHGENLVLAINTTIRMRYYVTAQWSIANAANHITCTNYMIA